MQYEYSAKYAHFPIPTTCATPNSWHHIQQDACVCADLFQVLVCRCIREAVMVEQAHFLTQEAVDHMSSSVLPMHQSAKALIQRAAQVHRPVIRVQGHLSTHSERNNRRRTQKIKLDLIFNPTDLFIDNVYVQKALAWGHAPHSLAWAQPITVLQSLEPLQTLMSWNDRKKMTWGELITKPGKRITKNKYLWKGFTQKFTLESIQFI